MWTTIPLHQRYHCDPWTVDVQEARIQRLHGGSTCGNHRSLVKSGCCFYPAGACNRSGITLHEHTSWNARNARWRELSRESRR